jgi:tight adherence protein C
MAYLLYAVIFILFLGIVALVVWGTRKTSGKDRMMATLDRLDAYDPESFRKAELAMPASERLFAPAVKHLSGVARSITPRSRVKKLERKIESAGRPWNLDVNGLLVLKLISLTVGLIILVVLAVLHLIPVVWFIVLALFVLVFTYYLPDLIIRSAADKRKLAISHALPDFLDLLTVSVEAGLGLDSAMAKISERLHGPLQEEILITLHQIRMGKARPVALRELADRCDVEDLTNFISALIQSQQLGVSLGQVLRVQSETIRIVQRQRIEARAQKAPVKMLIPLILCIFPCMFVVILGPAAIRIYDVLMK